MADQPPQYGQPQQVVMQAPAGNCPSCHVGNIIESFSIPGILLTIFCFPCGLICLFTMKDRKCSHCGFSPPS